jgi:predicted permease
LTDRVKSVPGVSSMTLAVVSVLADDEWDNGVVVEGYTPSKGEHVDPHMQYCSPAFFQTLKIPILLGRDFNIKDDNGAPKVGIVNQKFAKRYFGSASPLGRRLGMGIDPGTKLDIEIVGVVGDTKYENMREEIPYELYIPFRQADFVGGMTAYVRTAADPAAFLPMLRQAVREVDANVPMYDLQTLRQQIDRSLLTERLLASLSTIFGLMATLLAAIGLYGVMAYTVSQRTREIGIRMALGAETSNVVWLVMREVLTLAAIGLAIGLPAAWACARLVQSQLFGVRASDPFTIALAILSIAAVALLAGYAPARRATSIDPVQALRWD